jgi:hypothetical protein
MIHRSGPLLLPQAAVAKAPPAAIPITTVVDKKDLLGDLFVFISSSLSVKELVPESWVGFIMQISSLAAQ